MYVYVPSSLLAPLLCALFPKVAAVAFVVDAAACFTLLFSLTAAVFAVLAVLDAIC